MASGSPTEQKGPAVIEVPASPLQADAVREAAKKRGMSTGEYVLDCVLTYAGTHLQRSLADWIDQERQLIDEGNVQPCGAQLPQRGLNGEQLAPLVCVRMRGHQHDAVAALDTHAATHPEHRYNTWQAS